MISLAWSAASEKTKGETPVRPWIEPCLISTSVKPFHQYQGQISGVGLSHFTCEDMSKHFTRRWRKRDRGGPRAVRGRRKRNMPSRCWPWLEPISM